jgi:hypothetical protein
VRLAGVVDAGRLPNGEIVDVFCTPPPPIVTGCDVYEVPNGVHGCDTVEEENVDVGLNVVGPVVVVVTGGLPVKLNIISKFCRNFCYNSE